MCEEISKNTAENKGFERIIAVTNRSLSRRPFLEQIERICRHHPRAVLLREKDLPEEEYVLLAEKVSDVCRSYDVPFILHTYVQAARKLSCPFVHLPLPALRTYREERAGVQVTVEGKKKLSSGKKECEGPGVGTSVHSVEEALEARRLGAEYLIAGHIYPTDCKKGLSPRGTEFLREVCAAVDIPVYAIGGLEIGTGQLEEVLGCGAAGGCMMSGMMRL